MAADQENRDRIQRRPAESGAVASAKNLVMVIASVIALVCLSLTIILAYGAGSLSPVQFFLLATFLVAFAAAGTAVLVWLFARHTRTVAAAGLDGTIEWRTTAAEKQKRKLNAEVRELASNLGVDGGQLADLRAAYIVAEDLALRRVQNESGRPLTRKVSFGAADFDGVFTQGETVVCVSVQFLVRPAIPQEKINRLLREAAIAKEAVGEVRKGSRVSLLLLLVTQLDAADETKLRSTITDFFKATPVNVDIRWMDFQKLQRLYSDE